jgi:hypothetical protein
LEREGCDRIELTQQQYDDIAAAFGSPNGGITFSGGVTVILPLPTPPPPLTPLEQQAVAVLKGTFNTSRTATQVNNCIDALTVLLRGLYLDLH